MSSKDDTPRLRSIPVVCVAVALVGCAGGGDDSGAESPKSPTISDWVVHCPAPLNEADSSGWGDVEYRAWEEGGGRICYGAYAPLQHCGDGYRDHRVGAWVGDCYEPGIPIGLSTIVDVTSPAIGG